MLSLIFYNLKHCLQVRREGGGGTGALAPPPYHAPEVHF